MRAMPPATGNTLETSAKHKATNNIADAPIIHDMIDAGPANWAVSNGEKSQPDPKIPPAAIRVSDTRPTCRCSVGFSVLEFSMQL